MNEQIILPNQFFPTTTGQVNLTHITTDWLILYFYPKDSTAACTIQATDFSRLKPQFDALHATILGVSRDSVKSHQNFTTKHHLTIELISDPDEILCQYFNVIKQKNMYGRQVLGIERSTFLFYQGKLRQAYRKVKAKNHAEQLLESLQHTSSL